MSKMKKISIILPVYNGAATITRTLDSIVKQNVDEEIEVIVVNDCSTDNTQQILEVYKTKIYPHLAIVNLPENLRQGGARNAGVKLAKGKYIQFLDADDSLIDNSLEKLLKAIADNPDLDLLFFESAVFDIKNNTIKYSLTYPSNVTTTLSGEEYLSTQNVPWTPWMALYNKEFLLTNNISFAEKVRFEDADYVLKSVLLAHKVKYLPIQTVLYSENGSSTTNIGDDGNKIYERMLSADRLSEIITKYKSQYPKGTNVIKGHYRFKYHAILLRNLWRLDYKSIMHILRTIPYRDTTCNDTLISMAMNYPHIYASMSMIFGPILRFILKVRNSTH